METGTQNRETENGPSEGGRVRRRRMDMNIRIEKNVPVPTASAVTRRMGAISAAAESMEPGDSFLLPSNTNIGGALYYIRKKYPDRHYISRRESAGIRVWRKV